MTFHEVNRFFIVTDLPPLSFLPHIVGTIELLH